MMPLISPIYAHIPERISGLGELAHNLWWSWHPTARMIFKRLSRAAWKESIHNPVKMLRELPLHILESAARNPDYLNHYDIVLARFRAETKSRGGWFPEHFPESRGKTIAYLSAEYGLHHSLPFYAGGLGFLAGDHLKECSDLGVPVVGVGFMYPGGYLHQKIRVDGWQEHIERPLDRDAAPVTRVMDASGKQLAFQVPFTEPPISVAVWKVMVGRVPLYLLDTDIEANDPWNRSISSYLYIGESEQRLRQEIVLGIGGSEMLRLLGIAPSMIHLNEGHAAFALLEQVRRRVERGERHEDAVARVRDTALVTTHTSVPAGHDVFSFPLIDRYLKAYFPALGLDRDAFFQLGIHPDLPDEGFNMTALALRLSRYHNGVSRLHGADARRMWQSLWPDLREDEIPIESVTNGIHVPSWIDPKVELLFDRYLGRDWQAYHDTPVVWELIDDIPDEELWTVHTRLRMKLIHFINERARMRWREERVDPAIVLAEGTLLDPWALTIGFARRFASYKRPDLIFSDLERLIRLLNDRWRPVQVIFAGVAHPMDEEGKRIIQRVFSFARDPELGGRIAFVEHYDEQLAQYMVHGVDLWLNNPAPPMEASGTSGMKAAINGVPQLSILDGWWAEGYNGRNGWAFQGASGEERDRKDAEAIYSLLENEIVPRYYLLDYKGFPREWVRIMKDTIKSAGPIFNSRRMVKEYVERFYHHALAGAPSASTGL
jgi:glycogen phosphorylase